MESTTRHEQFLSRKYFASLDGLRCISILLVIWHHALGSQPGYLSRGYLGVGLFFVISGFLITTLLLRERRKTGSVALGQFYMRRTLRIFPLYFAVLGLYTALVWAMRPQSEADAQARATFFHNLPAFLTYTSNWFVGLDSGPRVIFYFAWSLATEEQFYLFWPWVVRGSRRWYFPLVMAIALIAIDQTAEHLVAEGLWSRSDLFVRVLTSIATPICMGCILAYLLDRLPGFDAAYRFLGAWWSAPLALVAVGVAIGMPSVHDDVVCLAMTWLVGACCIRPDHVLTPVLDNGVARYVGNISYGMYLLHMLALNVAKKAVPNHEAQPVWTFLTATVVAVVAASISYRFFERPFLKLKDRFRAPGTEHPEEPVAEETLAPVPALGTFSPLPR